MKQINVDVYACLNLGDDLFIKILAERYPNIQFNLTTDKKYAKPYIIYENIKIKKIGFINKIIYKITKGKYIVKSYYDKISRVNSYLYIGGSIFMQHQNWENEYKYRRSLLKNYDNIFFLGCNFGPYENPRFKELYENLYASCTDVCFRDKNSFNLFATDKVRYASDIIFQLDTNEINEIKLEKDYVLISVIDLSSRDKISSYQADYEDAIYKIINELLINGYNIKLTSFCKKEGDEIAIERIFNRLNSDQKVGVDKVYYDGNIEKILSYFKGAKAIVATRFHSLILGIVFNKKVFSFAYSNKINNVIYDLGLNLEYLDITNSSKINVKNVVNYLFDDIKYSISEIKSNSSKHFKLLDNILGENNE